MPTRKSQRQQELEADGYFVGPRDPKRNRAFKGKFMVCEREALTQPPSDSAGGGAYCIVGDNLDALIRDAHDHIFAGEATCAE